VAAAEAYLRGIERRIAAGLKPDVSSVASMFISRWDVAVTEKVPENLRNQLGIAIAKRTYAAYCSLVDSPRYLRIRNIGGRPQRLLWASTGTKDPSASDVRHDNRVVIADSVSRILGMRYLSRPTYLRSKDDRDHSLLVKRWWAPKCPDPRAARLAKYGEG
jgi:transaldolase